MITRKNGIAVLILISLGVVSCKNGKSYDTNDWIPITQPDGHNIQKKATGRVLTLSEPAPLRFFPEEYRDTRQAEFQQYLRETSSPVKQSLHKHSGQAQQRPFTPQDLERYYINQRQQAAQQQLDHANQQPHQFQIVPQRQFDNILYQQNLLKQVYPNLPPEYLIPPQTIQTSFQPQPLTYQTNPELQLQDAALQQTGPVQFTDSQLKQALQQPPTANGTVDFYNTLNLNFQQNYKPQTFKTIDITSTTPRSKENIQLVYVPLEQLQHNNKRVPQSNVRPSQIPRKSYQHQSTQTSNQQFYTQDNSFHKQQNLLRNIQNDFIQQALQAHKLQEQLEHGEINVEATTKPPTIKPTSKKRKPHQPPLAVYMNGLSHAKVTDVLTVLKEAKTIDVQDTIGPDSPPVFVGPANLDPPSGFSKFELPYLSSLESNRVERKVDQLPFFVAPLNYKTPPGYAKIPFPAPHVGTVIVNMNEIDKEVGENPNINEYLNQYQDVSSTTPLVLPKVNTGESSVHSGRNPSRTRSRIRTRPHTTEQSINHQTDGIGSTLVPSYSISGSADDNFNQNKYYPSVSTEHNPEYKVAQQDTNTGYQLSTTQEPKQTYSYLEEQSQAPRINQEYIARTSNKHTGSKPKSQTDFDIVKSISSTFSPYDEKQHSNFFSQFENFNQLTTTPIPHRVPQQLTEEHSTTVADKSVVHPEISGVIGDIYSIIPQINREKFLQEEAAKQKDRQYLPLNGHHRNKPQVNYDHLFQLPFITNSEVNQINSASRQHEKDKSPSHIENINNQKYVVFEEYPINKNTTPIIDQGRYTPSLQGNYENEGSLRSESQNLGSTYNHIEKEKEQQIINPVLPGLINDLEDQSIRQLLTPILLVPTEKTKTSIKQPSLKYESTTLKPKISTSEVYDYNPTVLQASTNEEPETTTSRRSKSRGRGNSRYNDRTTTVSPRRNSVRTRTPHPSRTRYTTTTTEAYEKQDYTTTAAPRRVSTRQRFRTRGRPQIAEGYSTTSSNVQITLAPTTTTNAPVISEEYLKDNYDSYTDEPIKKPQLITRSKILSPEQEYLINKYNLAYTVSQDPKTEKFNVEILSGSQKDSESQEDVVKQFTTSDETTPYHSTPHYSTPHYSTPYYSTPKVEVSSTAHTQNRDYSTVRTSQKSTTERAPVRIRARIRGRPKTTTTQAPTTEKPLLSSASSVEEEFYGFFRNPAFKQSSTEENYNSQENSESSKEFVSSPQPQSYEDERDDDRIQVLANNAESASRPVHFIGELLPKYRTTSEKYYEVTSEQLSPISEMYVLTTATSEVLSTKKRTRGRGVTRKPAEYQKKTYDELSNEVQSNESGIHRPVQRIRTRGRSHFKLPESITTEGNHENDNYPQLYLKAKEDQENYTPPTSKLPQAITEKFRITVEPGFEEVEDQEGHASILTADIILPDRNRLEYDSPKQMKFTGEKNMNVDFNSSSDNETTSIELEDMTTKSQSGDDFSKGERKGYWKLVKLRKTTDDFETAESQNIGIVSRNTFNTEEKRKTATEVPEVTEETSTLNQNSQSFLDVVSNSDEQTSLGTEKGITKQNLTEEAISLTNKPLEENVFFEMSAATITSKDSDINTIPETTHEFQLENFETTTPTSRRGMRNFETSTSTSTEISHETEICSRGVCVKSQDADTK